MSLEIAREKQLIAEQKGKEGDAAERASGMLPSASADQLAAEDQEGKTERQQRNSFSTIEEYVRSTPTAHQHLTSFSFSFSAFSSAIARRQSSHDMATLAHNHSHGHLHHSRYNELEKQKLASKVHALNAMAARLDAVTEACEEARVRRVGSRGVS